MIIWGRTAALVLGLVLVSSCTEMPVIKLNDLQQQRKLSSARQWQLVAGDLTNQIHEMVDGPGCVRINPQGTSPPSQFQQFLADVIVEEIVSPAGLKKINQLADPPDRASVAGPNTQLAAFRSDAPDHICDDITIQSIVIKHSGPPGRPPPGQYTLLAAGLVVARNVVNAFSAASGVGLVALGDVGFWASSGFRSGATVTEVGVTVSRVTPDKMYLAQFTNVYYINSGDSGLFEPAPELADAKANEDAPIPSHPEERALAQLRAADEERSKRLRHSHIAISPDTISACDPTVPLYITGSYLSPVVHGYQFGTVAGSRFGVPQPESMSGDAVQTVQVVFTGVTNSNKGLPGVIVSMAGTDGRTATGYVSFDDSTQCSKTAQAPATPKTAKPQGQKSLPDVDLSPKDKAVGFPVNICALPLEIDATEKSGAQLAKVETADGAYEASICSNPNHPGKVVSFAHLPDYSKAPPKGGVFRLKVTLQGGKTLDKQINEECVPQKSAVAAACH
jgi:hypothetical protein